MKSVVLDTNVLLDLFVFNDPTTFALKLALQTGRVDAVASSAGMAEWLDVLARPQFALTPNQQTKLVRQWQSYARILVDETLPEAPWRCQDPDDQIFLNLAYAIKPAILFSKDLALLKLASKAAKEHIIISAHYCDFSP
jgi:predicted nucleic acid-binding protein